VLRTPGLTPVVAVAVALGTVFGAVDVGLVAYGRANGWGAVAGALPSLITISSLTAGICFGLVRWRATLGTRLAAAGCLLAVGTALIPLVDRIGFVVAFAFVAGFPMAPVILTSTAIVGRLVAADRRTEGFGWIVIANGVGISLSAPVTGTLVDLAGARAGLLAVAAGGVGVAATTLVAARRLRTLADADRPGPAGQGPRVGTSHTQRTAAKSGIPDGASLHEDKVSP
jgi:MFS family permease